MTLRLALAVALLASPVAAVTDTQVGSYTAYAERLGALIGQDAGGGESRARCILTAFEGSKGEAGVDALMRLMREVSTGVEFDDPVVTGFNERYGSAYRQALRAC